jgi:hypothetical protein
LKSKHRGFTVLKINWTKLIFEYKGFLQLTLICFLHEAFALKLECNLQLYDEIFLKLWQFLLRLGLGVLSQKSGNVYN